MRLGPWMTAVGSMVALILFGMGQTRLSVGGLVVLAMGLAITIAAAVAEVLRGAGSRSDSGDNG